jgi:hypothetical protein
MKINQIVQETTTSGSVAPVEHGFVKMQTRSPSVYGSTKAGSLFKGKKTKAPYANSINESAELSEADLQEDDIIVVPGQGRVRKTGFVPHGQSRVDHEVEMARSDLFSAAKNAQQVHAMIKHVSEDEGLEGWVQEKIIKANDYLNTVREYLEGKQVQGMAEGLPQTLRKVVPGYAKREIDKKMDAGKFGKTDADKDANFQRYKKIQDKIKEQGMLEGAKVDRMVKHIEKSEKKLGKSKDEAENIAWATANKRGMLDNKNKKAK